LLPEADDCKTRHLELPLIRLRSLWSSFQLDLDVFCCNEESIAR
jgi:hypothetical protein